MDSQYIEVRGGPVVKVAYGHAAMLRDQGVDEDVCTEVLQQVHGLEADEAAILSMLAFHFEIDDVSEESLS